MRKLPREDQMTYVFPVELTKSKLSKIIRKVKSSDTIFAEKKYFNSDSRTLFFIAKYSVRHSPKKPSPIIKICIVQLVINLKLLSPTGLLLGLGFLNLY